MTYSKEQTFCSLNEQGVVEFTKEQLLRVHGFCRQNIPVRTSAMMFETKVSVELRSELTVFMLTYPSSRKWDNGLFLCLLFPLATLK
jgi:hypothetical protein